MKQRDLRSSVRPKFAQYGYHSHETETMRSVNVAELKNQLSKYLTFAKNGEEIVIRDRRVPVARLIPFSAENASEQELLLVGAGKLRMPRESVDLGKLLTVPPKRTTDRAVTDALLEEREQSR
jgi:antitoxin (DNA-binding transcriptional repressor) of toxin-antitoxin stability system